MILTTDSSSAHACLAAGNMSYVLSSCLLPTSSNWRRKTWAQCYGGHQFGYWAGQLGDGRAISLGQVVCPDGQRLELQLKVQS